MSIEKAKQMLREIKQNVENFNPHSPGGVLKLYGISGCGICRNKLVAGLQEILAELEKQQPCKTCGGSGRKIIKPSISHTDFPRSARFEPQLPRTKPCPDCQEKEKPEPALRYGICLACGNYLSKDEFVYRGLVHDNCHWLKKKKTTERIKELEAIEFWTKGNIPIESGWYHVKYLSNDIPPIIHIEKLWYNTQSLEKWWVAFPGYLKAKKFACQNNIISFIESVKFYDIIDSQAERIKELEAEKREVLENPKRWMKWCDEKMLALNEKQAERIKELEQSERAAWEECGGLQKIREEQAERIKELEKLQNVECPNCGQTFSTRILSLKSELEEKLKAEKGDG